MRKLTMFITAVCVLFLIKLQAEDLGLKKVRFILADPPYERYFTEVIPSNNIWWLRDPPPHAFIFQANLSGPPSESFQSFQWSPLLGSQLRLIPPFCSPKNQVIPPKILRSPPPPRTISNDRSPRTKISMIL